MNYKIACIPGDGVGPEIVGQAVKVLKAVEKKFGHAFEINWVLAAGEAIEKTGDPMPADSLKTCLESDAVILGNLGGSKWENEPLDRNPVKTIFILRKEMGITTNLRPVSLNPYLKDFSPLKDYIVKEGINILVVRDLLGGMLVYDKKTGLGEGGKEASDLEYYNEAIISKSAKIAFNSALNRRRKVSSLDKANVLASSKLWRETVKNISLDYPSVELENYLIDNAAMEVIKEPSQFDVIVTSNMFGDIIADELSQLTGTATMLASAEINEEGRGLYTPNQLHHPDETIIGKNIINPIGMIASTALMLRHSLKLEEEARAIEDAINRALESGVATEDIYSKGSKLVATDEMGDLIAKNI